ncbi:flagellar assembly peptidoglycan hydrolase FlgJ, partial [Vibrio sp. V26_P1S5P106]|uniref:rod-binding protein n=2 Tax=Vibrio TaxID=662 RepID=UPI001372439B
MINNANDIGFIHDIASLDKLRQKAVSGDDGAEKEALTAAARQFESIFTSMMLKSMRDANSSFKSELFSSQNEDFYRQMQDEQMISELSASGSLGLADMIVAQLSVSDGGKHVEGDDRFPDAMQRVKAAREAEKNRPSHVETTTTLDHRVHAFDSPQSFVSSLKPYADKVAKTLGVDASLLLAQAALETGWGQKLVSNARGSSN